MGHKHTHIELNQGGRLLRGLLIAWIAVCGLGLTAPVAAAERSVSGSIKEIGPNEFVSVPLYKSKIIEVQKPVKKLSVGNPDIADILILRANQVYVVGKTLPIQCAYSISGKLPRMMT